MRKHYWKPNVMDCWAHSWENCCSVELQMVLQRLLMSFAAKLGFLLNRSSRFWVWARHINWKMPESGSNPVGSYPLLLGVTSLSCPPANWARQLPDGTLRYSIYRDDDDDFIWFFWSPHPTTFRPPPTSGFVFQWNNKRQKWRKRQKIKTGT